MNSLAIFGTDVFASLVSSWLIATLYIWPRLLRMDREEALSRLTIPHMSLRYIGLAFLVPGVVSPLLPAAFTHPVAYGDLIAGILAVIAVVGLWRRASWAVAAVWVFNLWGTADFLYAFYAGLSQRMDPGLMGAAFFIPTTILPPLLVTHLLIFRLLVRSKLETSSSPATH